MFIVTIGLFAASIPAYYDSLVSFSDPELDAAAARASLEAAGVSMEFYARYLVPISVAYTMVFFVVGTVIFWRRSDNWIALFASMCLITFGTFGLYEGALALPDQVQPCGCRFAYWRSSPRCQSIHSYSSFPTDDLSHAGPAGRSSFLPCMTSSLSLPRFYLQHRQVILPLLDAVVLSIVICIPILSQLYRYRYVSTPAERQQTKWVVFGVVTSALAALAFEVPISGSPLGQFGPLQSSCD